MALVIQEHVPLSSYTTLKTGGVARYLVTLEEESDLSAVASFLEETKLPHLVLGGGSNMLVADAGFLGVVVLVALKGRTYETLPDGQVLLTAGAGEVFDEVVAESVERGYFGLENLSAIPGSVGAVPVQNVGAYGVEVGQLTRCVRAYHVPSKTIREFTATECAFGYRDSFFKTSEGATYIILSVQFLLSTCAQPNIMYADLKNYFQAVTKEITIADVRQAVILIRSKKFPDWRVLGTAGSFFKNPIVDERVAQALKGKFPDLPVYPAGAGLAKVSLGYILDKACNLRGFRAGAVGLSEAQALVLINYGGATSAEILAFVSLVATRVFALTGIVIEPEVRFINCSLT